MSMRFLVTAEDAFANAGEPYFAPELLEAAQQQAPPPSPAQKGERYLKAWDIGRRDASVCVVLRAPAQEEAQIWQVVGYRRLVDQDYPAIQREIEAIHRQYPGPTVIEANSIGRPLIENLHLRASEVLGQTTTQASKQAMLTALELLLQQAEIREPRRRADRRPPGAGRGAWWRSPPVPSRASRGARPARPRLGTRRPRDPRRARPAGGRPVNVLQKLGALA